MDDSDWATLFEEGEYVAFSKGEVIMRDAERCDYVFLIGGGTVRVEKGPEVGAEDDQDSADLRAMVIVLEAGATFGEMSFLDDEPPCATCIADSTMVNVHRVSKMVLERTLQQDHQLSCKFYRQIAINVTQRLLAVSKASADIDEAPRGVANNLDSFALPVSAKKLLKVRNRLGIADTETMACMMPCTMFNPSRRKVHGMLYVFESGVGFVTKVFGLKQNESVPFSNVSEVVRETFTLKRSDNAVELVMEGRRSYIFYPQHADDAFDAMQRCLQQHKKLHAGGWLGLESRRPSVRRASLGPAVFERNPHERSSTADLSEESFKPLIHKATLERYKAGDVIIAEASRPNTLFNIAKGRVAVEVRAYNEDTQLMKAVKILTLYEPAMFGEMSYLSGEAACASVVAEVDTEVWQIKASTIDSTLSAQATLAQAHFFRHLASYLAARVRQLTLMVAQNYAAKSGELSLQEVLSNRVFFSLFKRFLAERQLVDDSLLSFLQELNDFLELPANEGMLSAARNLHSKYLQAGGSLASSLNSAEATAAISKLLASDTLPPRDLFAPLLSQVLERLQGSAYRLFRQSAAFQPLLDLKAKERHVPAVHDFKLLQILGEGYEGKVLQVRKKDCGVMYALKVLDKQILASRSKRWRLHASRELECLVACDHPYVVRLAYSFQTPQYLYMVQEHVPNHTMAQYLEAHGGGPVDEIGVRFMAAELALALAHMHTRAIVYRDLKPANVLVDAEGHLRVVDMGMAAKLDPDGRRKSVCGTARYMAPEMKDKKPYTTTVDWYSLGKLLVDFRGKGAGRVQPGWWEPSRLVELIDGLLIKDPAVRLGSGPDGLRQIQRSLFFAGVDWPAIDARRAPSPLRPEMYVRAPDVSASRQFRNGEDLAQVVEKLQHISLDTGSPVDSGIDGESHPGMLSDWEHVDTRSVYTEYLQSPYHNAKTSGL